LVRFNGTIELAHQRGLGIELLLRNDAFFEEKLVALEIHFGVLALGLVLGELALGLFKLDLKRPWINLHEKVALVNKLAFFKGHIDNLPVHAAANGDGVEGGDGS